MPPTEMRPGHQKEAPRWPWREECDVLWSSMSRVSSWHLCLPKGAPFLQGCTTDYWWPWVSVLRE